LRYSAPVDVPEAQGAAAALESDIGDVQGGTTQEGIHMGVMSGTLDLVQRGYTGTHFRDGALYFDPWLPGELDRLPLCMQFQGTPIMVAYGDGHRGRGYDKRRRRPRSVAARPQHPAGDWNNKWALWSSHPLQPGPTLIPLDRGLKVRSVCVKQCAAIILMPLLAFRPNREPSGTGPCSRGGRCQSPVIAVKAGAEA
jgi:hypothetical protein